MGVLILLFAVSPAGACSTPVHRYALENWAPNPYGLIVLHDRPLSADQEKLLASIAPDDPPANLVVARIDVTGDLDEEEAEAYRDLEGMELPAAILRQPIGRYRYRTIWRGPLRAKVLRPLAGSPLRTEIARRLIDGKAVVWILREGRSDDETRAAVARLRAAGVAPLRLRPGDAAESFFSTMLLNVEPDLAEYASRPMAFPVFGRGRALYALVDKGINKENVEDVDFFLGGPCACQVKAQNPGVDLLIAADWDAARFETETEAAPLPPLTGVLPALDADEADGAPSVATPPAAAERPIDDGDDDLPRGVLAAFAAVLILGGLIALRGRSR